MLIVHHQHWVPRCFVLALLVLLVSPLVDLSIVSLQLLPCSPSSLAAILHLFPPCVSYPVSVTSLYLFLSLYPSPVSSDICPSHPISGALHPQRGFQVLPLLFFRSGRHAQSLCLTPSSSPSFPAPHCHLSVPVFTHSQAPCLIVSSPLQFSSSSLYIQFRWLPLPCHLSSLSRRNVILRIQGDRLAALSFCTWASLAWNSWELHFQGRCCIPELRRTLSADSIFKKLSCKVLGTFYWASMKQNCSKAYNMAKYGRLFHGEIKQSSKASEFPIKFTKVCFF